MSKADLFPDLRLEALLDGDTDGLISFGPSRKYA